MSRPSIHVHDQKNKYRNLGEFEIETKVSVQIIFSIIDAVPGMQRD